MKKLNNKLLIQKIILKILRMKLKILNRITWKKKNKK